VSIITPTWQRHKLLMETITDVRQQTYPNLEHVVVSDGPDDVLAQLMAQFAGGVPIAFTELGRNWTSEIPRSFGVAPLSVGALLARGEYHMWLCDDERMQPHHVEHLVDLIESSCADFVYPQVLMWKTAYPGIAWTIGTDPPQHCQITHVLYRASLLAKAAYRFHMPEGIENDWDMVNRWMEAGATWAMSPECTISHRADH
jgi:glycosyltransferase involved in cell wall biosynthesis